MPGRNETYVHTEACKQMSPAMLFMVAQSENNPSVHHQIKELKGTGKVNTPAVGCYSVL